MQGSSLAATLAGRTAAPARTGLVEQIAAYIPLVKPKIIVLLGAYGAVAALVAGEGRAAPGTVLLFTLLAMMAAGGAACLNQLFERHTDAVMERTRNRPLPSGRVSPAGAAMLAWTLLGLAIPLAWRLLGGAVALQLALGAVVYSGLYTLILKPRTHWNIVIGGFAGSNMALAGWAVVDPGLAPGAWLMALVVFLWTPPHFWGLAIARDQDYRKAGIPMLPQVAGVGPTARSMVAYAVGLWAATVALAYYTVLSGTYLGAALVLGAGFTAACVAFWRRPTLWLASAVFKGSGIYLLLLLLAMSVDLWLGRM